jgi:MoxR-like ATPase/Skp family chaperone for outer membrane proteins
MRLIAVRRNSFNTGSAKGFVVPIAHENDDLTITLVQPDEFPNNQRIWISSEYELIENQFLADEIFYLNSYRDTWEPRGNSEDEHARVAYEKEQLEINPNKCRYYALGSSASRIDSSYMQVIDLPHLPDMSTGRYTSHLMPKFPSVGTPFMVSVEGYLYGPFQIRRDSAMNNSDDIIFETVNRITPLSLQNNYIAKIKLKDVESLEILLRVSTANTVATYITNLHAIKNSIEYETIDYISDSGLINYFTRNDFFKDSPLSKSNASALRSAIENFVRKGQIGKQNERVERLYNILDDFIENDSQNFDLVKRYFATKDGERFLSEFLSKHEDAILREHLTKIREKNNKELEDATRHHEEQIKQLNSRFASEKAKVDAKIGKLNEEFTKAQEEQQKKISEMNTENLKKDVSDLQGQINDLKKELGLLESVKEITNEILRLRGRRESIEEDVREKQTQLDNVKKMIHVQSNLLKNPSQLMESYATQETLRFFSNGGLVNRPETTFELEPITKAAINVTGETRISYLNYLQHKINENRERPISYNETANLVVSVMQNYLTVFNGLPGVGKTSTVTNFAKALGIAGSNSNKANFLNVAVARGWTSSKDLLGNKNAIRSRYEEGRTGIYNMLKALEQSAKNPGEGIINHEMLSIILLDEANLSPMEHYWSDFLSICDNFKEGRTMNLGGNDDAYKLILPPSLRFIATINSDSTVEPLSDRLIDRATVITLDNDLPNQDASGIIESELFNGAVPYAELAEAFMIEPSDREAMLETGKLSSEEHILREIMAKLEAPMPRTSSIRISKRKEHAIMSYCAIANELSYQQVDPIDFAVAQHIIPKIKGHGSGFKERLNEVDKVLSEARLQHSKRLLKYVLDNGSEYADTYSLL